MRRRFYAADLGLKVALVDPEANPGGVCVYRGCIPSKALLHVADVIDESRHAEQLGRRLRRRRPIDLDELRDFKNKVVVAADQRHRAARRSCGRSSTCRDGARFSDAAHARRRSSSSGGKDTLQFEHAILATGSLPATIPGAQLDDPRVMDSTGALDLPDIPKSLLVVGGGYIGLELGTVYAALGSAVTVVEMTPGCCRAPIAISSTSSRSAIETMRRPCC